MGGAADPDPQGNTECAQTPWYDGVGGGGMDPFFGGGGGTSVDGVDLTGVGGLAGGPDSNSNCPYGECSLFDGPLTGKDGNPYWIAGGFNGLTYIDGNGDEEPANYGCDYGVDSGSCLPSLDYSNSASSLGLPDGNRGGGMSLKVTKDCFNSTAGTRYINYQLINIPTAASGYTVADHSLTHNLLKARRSADSMTI